MIGYRVWTSIRNDLARALEVYKSEVSKRQLSRYKLPSELLMGKTSKINILLLESRTPVTNGAVDPAQASCDIIQETSIPHSDVKCHLRGILLLYFIWTVKRQFRTFTLWKLFQEAIIN